MQTSTGGVMTTHHESGFDDFKSLVTSTQCGT